MTDQELAQMVKDRAQSLAAAMNEAGRAGLHIELEMRPHERAEDGCGNVKITGYRPILAVVRRMAL